MMVRFSECAVVTNWLPHTSVQIFFCLILVYKTVWCSFSSLSIQTGVLVVTFCITLLLQTKRAIGSIACLNNVNTNSITSTIVDAPNCTISYN